MGVIQLLLFFSMSSCDKKKHFSRGLFIAFVSITLRPFIFTGQ